MFEFFLKKKVLFKPWYVLVLESKGLCSKMFTSAFLTATVDNSMSSFSNFFKNFIFFFEELNHSYAVILTILAFLINLGAVLAL